MTMKYGLIIVTQRPHGEPFVAVYENARLPVETMLHPFAPEVDVPLPPPEADALDPYHSWKPLMQRMKELWDVTFYRYLLTRFREYLPEPYGVTSHWYYGMFVPWEYVCLIRPQLLTQGMKFVSLAENERQQNVVKKNATRHFLELAAQGMLDGQ